MKMPLSLLKSFIDIDLSTQKIAETLTLLGIEVDHIFEEESADTPEKIWDPVFELSLTPNLGHCMSALGIARELSAYLQIPLRQEKAVPLETGAPISFTVENTQEKLCTRYMCRLLEDVRIGPSPSWLQQVLLHSGYRPINNVVDALNFIMLKMGQPFHAFDADRLSGKKIVISSAKNAQPFVGLDGIERTIPEGACLISDGEKPIAIAGVIGSEDSMVQDETKNILIEAAVFDFLSVRKTAKKLALRTESAQRFEKGIDPNGIHAALDEVCALLLKLCGGRLAKGWVDWKKQDFSPKHILCRSDRVNRILGTNLSVHEIESIFQRLQFTLHKKENGVMDVYVPLFRSDINEEIDLCEEVARIYGYNNIEKRPPLCVTSSIPHDPDYLFERELKRRLSGLSLSEMINTDLISNKLAELAQEFAHIKKVFLRALHAKSDDYSILRPSLLPGLLQSVQTNLDQKNSNLHVFEIGRVHFRENEIIQEIPIAAVLLTGKTTPHHWDEKPRDVDFFDLKGIIENLLAGLPIKGVSFQGANHPTFHPGRQAEIRKDECVIGSLGEIHPSLLAKLDIKQRVLYAELNAHHLQQLRNKQVQFHPFSPFPSSERDWTLSLDLSTSIASILDRIPPSRFLEKVELRDLFFVDAEKKNATFRFTYRDLTKTLSFEEVEKEHAFLLAQISGKI